MFSEANKGELWACGGMKDGIWYRDSIEDRVTAEMTFLSMVVFLFLHDS